MPKFTLPDREILAAALVGLEKQLADVDGKIASIRSRVGGKRGPAKAVAAPASSHTGRRTLSAAARRRIGAAQKKRWAAFHESQG